MSQWADELIILITLTTRHVDTDADADSGADVYDVAVSDADNTTDELMSLWAYELMSWPS